MSPHEYDYIDDADALDQVLQSALTAERYALDTEFHRERSYYPRAALVQLAWHDRLVLIDPLAVSIEPMARLLDGPGVAVMHAAGQDLELLQHVCATIPATLFDTQIAAGFVGMKTPSLAALHDKLLGIRLGKQDRLTDWLHRPLAEAQLEYARRDVAYLFQIHDELLSQLEARGRLDWARAECEALRARGFSGRDPDQAWQRLKETRHLGARARGVAQAVAAWRERRAAETDQPVRFILSELAIVALAQKPPSTKEELRRVRGIDERFANGRHGEALLEVIREAKDRPDPVPKRVDKRSDARQLRPAATLVSAWLAHHASSIDLDPALLATRSDIEAFLRGDESPLNEGWRAELAGEPIRRLVAGEAALAFDDGNGLLLEERSYVPIRKQPAQPPSTRPG